MSEETSEEMTGTGTAAIGLTDDELADRVRKAAAAWVEAACGGNKILDARNPFPYPDLVMVTEIDTVDAIVTLTWRQHTPQERTEKLVLVCPAGWEAGGRVKAVRGFPLMPTRPDQHKSLWVDQVPDGWEDLSADDLEPGTRHALAHGRRQGSAPAYAPKVRRATS